MVSITVKNLTGKVQNVEISLDSKVRDLVQQVCDENKMEPNQLQLVYNGKVISDEQSIDMKLSTFGIKGGDTVHSLIRLRGG